MNENITYKVSWPNRSPKWKCHQSPENKKPIFWPVEPSAELGLFGVSPSENFFVA